MSVMVRVEDVRAHCARARAAGATIVEEPTDHVYGERQYGALDDDFCLDALPEGVRSRAS